MATEDLPRVDDGKKAVVVSFFSRALNGLRSAFTPKTCVSCSRLASSVAVPVLSSTLEKVEEVAEKVEETAEKVEETAEKVKEAVKEAVEEAVKEVVEEKVKEAVEEKVKEVAEKVVVEDVVVVATETPAESTPPQEATKSE